MNKKVIVNALIIINLTLCFFLVKEKKVSNEIKDLTDLSLKHINIENLNKTYTHKEGNSSVKFIVVINDKACGTCVVDEVDILNEFQHIDKIMVISIGENLNYLKDLGANFSYVHFDNDAFMYNVKNSLYNPLMLIMDNNFLYQKMYFNNSLPLSKHYRESHYQALTYLIENS